MHGEGLQLALVFLIAAVVAVPLFKRFGLGAVLGYLCAGVVLGPSGLRAVADAAPVLTASEIGVVMMLFIIGLELSPRRLWVMRRDVFGLGGLQVLVTGLAFALIGMSLDLGWKLAVVIGFALALSSTAVSLQLLSERRSLSTPHGRTAFSILLFQDLAAIPLIAAIPLLGQAATEGASTTLDVLKAIAAISAVVIGGRYLLRHLFRLAARIGVPEMLTAAALLAVLGSAFVMQLAHLSAGLGAFLAGVLLADSEFRHEIEAQIEPFKGLLLGLFFMAVGMSIDLGFVAADPLPILIGTALLLLTKATMLLLIGWRPGGLRWRENLRLAAVMALGGEFAFVVLGESLKVGLIETALRDQLFAVVALSMALTPLILLGLAAALGDEQPEAAEPQPADPIEEAHPQVILAGFGRMGQIIGRMLHAQGIPFTALENSAEQVEFSRRFGHKIYYGDSSRPELLRAARTDQAKLVVVTTADPDANLRAVRVIKRLFPQVKVIARARNRQHAFRLMDLGVDGVIRETFHSALDMGRQAFEFLGMPAEQAQQLSQTFREHDEQLMQEQHLMYDDEAALVASSTEARAELARLFEADSRTAGRDASEDALNRSAPGTGQGQARD